MHFKSKIDNWILLILFGVPLGLLVLMLIDESISFSDNPAPLVIVAALFVFIFWIIFSTGYSITDSELIVRSGPFRWKINLGEIKSIEPSRSTVSSPALSLDRLKISYGKNKRVLISPLDKEKFISELKSHNLENAAI